MDANLEPRVAELLREEGYRAEYSDYVLDVDADDEADILPYVRSEELVIITADVKNFAPLEATAHEGLLLLNHQRASAHEVAGAVLALIEEYRSPDNMAGKVEVLDPWLEA